MNEPRPSPAPPAPWSASARASIPPRGEVAYLLVVILLLAAVVVIRSAWISDDAYITFRTVDNFAGGYGPTWNVSERVQAYTHPLWMLVISAAHFWSGEFYYTTLALSLGITLAALAVFAFGLARSLPAAILGLGVLIQSKAFVDYSTSGLENPLTHLLLASFCVVFLRPGGGARATARRLVRSGSPEPGLLLPSLIAGLMVLNRMDTALFVAPALAWALWSRRSWASVRSVVLGFAPFVLWELFSLVYYGFPFPNTAYAKLGTALPRGDLIRQGLFYLLDSLENDPLTLPVIGAGLLAPVLLREARAVLLAAGIFLYLAYVVWIGADFMSGRALSAALLGAVVLVARLPGVSRWAVAGPALGVVTAVGLLAPHPPVLSGADFGRDYDVQKEALERNGISDERAFYYPVTGLLRATRRLPVPSPRQVWVDQALRVREPAPAVVVRNSVGFYGLHAGPEVHVIDEFGLGDALLARLPPAWRHDWRIGHFFRVVPDGYAETVATGRNLLKDPDLARYWEHLSTLTRGPVFAGRRLVEIAKMNLGAYDGLIDRERYRYPGMRTVGIDRLDGRAAPADDASSAIVVPGAGVRVDLGAVRQAPAIELDLDRNHDYVLVYRRDGREISRNTLWALPGEDPALVSRRTRVPPAAQRRGYDAIHVLPAEGVGEPRLGRLRLLQ